MLIAGLLSYTHRCMLLLPCVRCLLCNDRLGNNVWMPTVSFYCFIHSQPPYFINIDEPLLVTMLYAIPYAHLINTYMPFNIYHLRVRSFRQPMVYILFDISINHLRVRSLCQPMVYIYCFIFSYMLWYIYFLISS